MKQVSYCGPSKLKGKGGGAAAP